MNTRNTTKAQAVQKAAPPSQNGKHTADKERKPITPMELATLAAIINPSSAVFADYDEVGQNHPTVFEAPANKMEETLRKATHLYLMAAKELQQAGTLPPLKFAIRYRLVDSMVDICDTFNRPKWEETAVWHYPNRPGIDLLDEKGKVKEKGDPLRTRLANAERPHKDSSEQLLRSLFEHFHGGDESMFQEWKKVRRKVGSDGERYAIYEHEVARFITERKQREREQVKVRVQKSREEENKEEAKKAERKRIAQQKHEDAKLDAAVELVKKNLDI